MRQETLHGPSGLVVVVRSRKTKDFDIITGDDPDAEDRYIEQIIMKTVDQGPYPDSAFYANGKPRVSDSLLMGDFWAILLKHHELNKPGNPFLKMFECDGDTCGYIEEIKLMLGTDESKGKKEKDGIYRLPLRLLSEESAMRFKDGEQFETSINGTTVFFKLQDRAAYKLFLKHAQPTAKRTTSDEKYTALLASRIERVQGVGESFESIRQWIGELDEDDEDELTERMDMMDCGVDWDLWPHCRRCGEDKLFRVVIDKNFFSRGRQRRRPPL